MTTSTQASAAVSPVNGGVYVISIRRGLDRETTRAEAYAHVGIAVDGIDRDLVALAEAFTSKGFSVADLTTYLDNLSALAVNPDAVPGDVRRMMEPRGGVDSEGHATDLFMVGLGEKTGDVNWLACAEAAHATWPRLLDLLGASVGGVVINDGADHKIDLPDTRVPRALRLKSGWDYDAEGNQVWLPIEEAWRRFVAHNDERGDGAEGRLDAKTMKRMRRHMKGFYAKRAKAKAS